MPQDYETATEFEVRVSMQKMFNKTAECLVDALGEEDNTKTFENSHLIVNIGFDSSSGHLSPHQKTSDEAFDKEKSNSSQQTLTVMSMSILSFKYDSIVYTNLNLEERKKRVDLEHRLNTK